MTSIISDLNIEYELYDFAVKYNIEYKTIFALVPFDSRRTSILVDKNSI